MERPLGIFETAETLTDAAAPFNVVGVIELDTGISPGGLSAALERAQRRHPLLRARIVDPGDGWRYDLDGAPRIPLEIIKRRDASHWREIVEAELNRAFDLETGPLMRCILLVGKSGTTASELVVSFLHTIIDGTSAVNLVREILEAWNASASGRRLKEPEILELQPPVEAFFPPEYRGLRGKLRIARFMARQLADEIGYRRHARGTRRMKVHPAGRCRSLSRDLGGDDVVALVRATRRHRVTLNSALNAAMLLVVQDRLYDGAAVPLRNFNFAIMRPYLRPPINDHHLGSFHVMLRSTVDIEARHDFWQLASTINSQLVANARRGDKYLSLLTVADVMRFILGQRKMRMAATALAYTGPLKMPQHVGAIRIRGVRTMVSNLMLGPEYTAHARLFGGRLCWDQVYLDCDMDEATAGGITDAIFDLLRRMAREPA
jgi:hypothetical protein